MKYLFASLFACMAWLLLSAVAMAGSATHKESVVFNVPFAKLVKAVKDNQGVLWSESLGHADVIADRGTELDLKVTLPRRSGTFTVRIDEAVDENKKTAKFQSKLIKTDGLVKAQSTSVSVYEKNGKVYADIVVSAEVTDVGDSLIRLDIRRSVNKMVQTVNDLVE